MTPVLRMRGIGKTFPGVRALDGVDLEVYAGEVHALLGENGAGKSTLCNVLSGGFAAYDGSIEVTGASADIHHPRDAQRLGIGMIHQELNLALAAQLLLARYRHESRLCIGVARDGERGFEAHAWIEAEGRVVVGGGRRLERYSRLPDLAGVLSLK